MAEVGDKWGFDGRNRWAHSGMLRAASAIRTELESLGLLDRIFDLGFESEVLFFKISLNFLKILLVCF